MSKHISISKYKRLTKKKGKKRIQSSPVKTAEGRFDSKGEFNRWEELKFLVANGSIEELSLHPKFDMKVNDVKIGTYTPDFMYWDCSQNMWIVEDYKGSKATETPLFRWKRKHFQAQYPRLVFRTVYGKS